MIDFTPSGATCHIALGSNLSDPRQQIRTAIANIARLSGVQITAVSSLYRSAAVGHTDQPDFINAVIRLHTRLEPPALLRALLDIEQFSGRQRSFRNAPRVIDLDILLYNQLTWQDEQLTLPHPRMHERAFVLLPLLEITPDAVIPGLGAASRFLAAVGQQSIVRLEQDEIAT
ncbi:MAG: 2-amino-4-hydroxy-6-hydroxymethyldihydropteridine diphosphokinase [Betaproteobacteria bacterium]|nr:2-amino-4-hydroxy-6-hydroxymethyldihydropteridine diphosphokinase [Betaproteobacteria bacterium]